MVDASQNDVSDNDFLELLAVLQVAVALVFEELAVRGLELLEYVDLALVQREEIHADELRGVCGDDLAQVILFGHILLRSGRILVKFYALLLHIQISI